MFRGLAKCRLNDKRKDRNHTINSARKSNMKEAEVLAPVEVALKIYQHIIQSVFRPHMRSSDKQRTLDTLPSTFLIFAKIILPIKINPIILDQTATSRSRCKISTRRLSSEVTRSIPPCLVVPSSRGGNSAAP
jgi:hypothetical protein